MACLVRVWVVAARAVSGGSGDVADGRLGGCSGGMARDLQGGFSGDGGGRTIHHPGVVLQNVSDKLYEKQKNAHAREHEKISSAILLLTNDFTYSPQANHSKGGLIGLAAVTVGLISRQLSISRLSRGDFIIYSKKILDALCKAFYRFRW